MRPTLRRGPAWAVCFALGLATACHREPPVTVNNPTSDPTEGLKPRPPLPADEIPAGQLDEVLRAHLEGLGMMERYEYDKAVRLFGEVHERAPGWIAGSINLAIALLNQSGDEAEQARKGGGGNQSGPEAKSHFDRALGLLDEVLAREPNNLYAHFCRGIILEYQGDLPAAHRDFGIVTEKDPTDAHAWYRFGSTLTDPDNPRMPAGPKQAKTLIAIYTKALERNPYLVSALHRLHQAYAWSGDRATQAKLIALFQRLNPQRNAAAPGELSANFYGEMGRYARVINPPFAPTVPTEAAPPPRFDAPAPLRITLPAGDRWVKDDDFEGTLAAIGRAHARFGPAVAAFDADGDGTLDLFLASAVRGAKGVRDALLLNKGDGRFEEASRSFGLPDDRPSLGVAAGDFDADRKIDLFLTGVGTNRLLRNEGARFHDVTEKAGIAGRGALTLTARWLDLDQDGDLDLYLVNYTEDSRADEAFRAGKSVPGLANAAYRNDGKPAAIAGRTQDNWAPLAVAPDDLGAKEGLSLAFTAWPEAEALLGGKGPHTAVAALDLDDDRDIDLVLAADGEPPLAVLNDRLGRFHAAPLKELDASGPISGLLVSHLDKDGRADLVAVGREGRVFAWRNATERGASALAWEPWPCDAKGWRSASIADLDLDGWADLVGTAAAGGESHPAWARNDGRRLRAGALALGPGGDSGGSLDGVSLADWAGDPLPDLLLVESGKAPRLARNRGNGLRWLALDLSGRWKTSFDQMRTNPHGLGTRVIVEGQGLDVPYDHTTPDAGLGQSVAPIVLGLSRSPSAALVRLRWPDGTMQCELNVAADQRLALAERNRKTGSCPVLFTWNGERFECIGDFLGGGGLGYLVAPGVYGQPDRDEAVSIGPRQLRPAGGAFRLAVAEPMDELSYLDMISLEAIDRPPGVEAAPDERFVPEGPRPSGRLLAWRDAIRPVRATDLGGRDITDRLMAFDRRTADGFRRLSAWTGYAEEHGIVLDFGDRLSRYGPGDRLALGLAGWVEYPYSQTNYAAATAGHALRPPALERLREDGSWELIEPQAGYPAGLPRLTMLELTGKLSGPRCVLRLRTNMECYWDEAFVAAPVENSGVRVTPLEVGKATLAYRGYMRETSPDGRPPLLYDYEHVDPAPLARLSGTLTRYGEVAELLRRDDDRLCLVGPGDEVRLEFDAGRVPALPEGWTRSFVLRTTGYCKDADPFTATGDRVEPLPWRTMPAFPFGPEVRRPEDPDYSTYLREFQTRSAQEP